jgi:hypothetical protein
VDGLAEDAGIEEADAGDVFGTAGADGCGSESQQGEGKRLNGGGAQTAGDRDEHGGLPRRDEHVSGLRIVAGFRDF